jgi:hypothetical protein
LGLALTSPANPEVQLRSEATTPGVNSSDTCCKRQRRDHCRSQQSGRRLDRDVGRRFSARN